MSSWTWRSYHRIQALLAPKAKSCQDYYLEALQEYVPAGGEWLDLGCGWRVLRPWLAEGEAELVARSGRMIGIDPEEEAVAQNRSVHFGIVGLGNALPFADQTFDIVTANMVVEHLSHPERELSEVFRVLRPGGRFVFLTPNARGYLVRLATPFPQRFRRLFVRIVEQRSTEDRFETYYRANTPESIGDAAAGAGLVVTECRYVLSAAEFARLLPFAVIELLWIRLLSGRMLNQLRPNLVAVLTRPA